MIGLNATINQLVKTFEIISENHAQINDFFAGRFEDFNASSRNYACLWIDLVDVTQYELYSDLVFRIGVLDILNTDTSNQWEIISDSNSIIRDILIILRDTYDLLVDWGKGKQLPVLEYGNDNLGGSYIDVTIAIPYDTALADIPLKSN